MPTSLRELLDKPNETALALDEGTSPRWQREAVESQYFSPSYSKNIYCDALANSCWINFCIENSMDFVTFELWGGGGGGAGGCCCSWGVPGGAGAYSTITINNTSNGYTGCICMCVANASCCSPNSCCGYRGCKTSISGSGLTNICADGGLPGCGFCNFFNCFPNNCCGVLEHPCNSECAEFFGCATNQPSGENVCVTGIAGRYGWLQTDCYSPGDFCWYKVAFPIPGGLGTTEVGYKLVRAFCNTGTSADNSRVGGVSDSAIGGSTCDYRAVGQGGNTARVCGGGCCCGWPGGPGLIKISWT